MRIVKSADIATHLISLYWLNVKVVSIYKIDCLCYHCNNSPVPSYISDMMQKKQPHSHNTRSSSHTTTLLNRPAHSKATLGDHQFPIASYVWGSIPNDVKCDQSLSSPKCNHLSVMSSLTNYFVSLYTCATFDSVAIFFSNSIFLKMH